MKLNDGGIWKNIVIEEKAKVAETLDEFRGHCKYNLLDEQRPRASTPRCRPSRNGTTTRSSTTGTRPRSLDADDRYTMKQVSLLAARASRAFQESCRVRHAGRGRVGSTARSPTGRSLDVFFLDLRSYRGAERRQSTRPLDTRDGILGARPARVAEARAAELARHLEGDRRRHAARRHRLGRLP